MFVQNWYQCEIQPVLINLNPNEYSQELHYYQFVVRLDKCSGNCSTPNDSSYRVCVPKKTGDLNLHVFNMITAKNESKILTKNISCKCNCRFDGKNVSQMNAGDEVRKMLAFLLIAIVLLVYCYLIKYPAKQKRLLPFHNANNELKQVLY